MSDLIRRIDAVQACQVGPSDEWSRSTKSGYNQAATDCAMNILRVPAVQPDTVQAQIDAAVLAERERCAVIADAQEARAAAREKEAPDDENDFANGLLFGTKIGARIIAAEIRKGDQPDAHVNETPKSEHVPGDMLTPATKEDVP